ncbi:MAG: hypothetical protein UV73_C0002G0139 [Candidatus Gottesmanbacteria bacterium GW2011_GWA2_43_14]|uniref:Uncharacterized protein n=1 Tax=Candidatus Gottesmanbacteria bacterium GW2011_GWA2_43_14 TaxID=1618443 RepID=A0A0G1DKN2_9BACT|nr:MAG: hypothetical protein UV73_C0002G0139 [Candidatus Gottesmanbacteria bacterium GW2011_GWA2_43_14]
MNFKRYIKNASRRINILIIVLVSVFFVIATGFFYIREKNREKLYLKVILGRDYQIPYWNDQSLEVGNSDRSSFGIVNAKIIDKESYEWNGPGRFVILLLEVRAVKDRAGLYLFKNKPLSLGEFIDMRFPRVHQSGLVTYISTDKPKNLFQNLQIVIKKRGELPEIDDHTRIGDTLKNNKGETVAEITGKTSKDAEIRTNTDTGATVITYDRTRKDMDLTLNIRVNKTADGYVFQEMQKVKIGDKLNIHFKGISLWDFRVTQLKEI